MINAIPMQPYGRNIVINGNGFLLAGQSEGERAAAIQKANQFQSDVWNILKKMEYGDKRQTAILLLSAINDGTTGKTLTIVPRRAQDGNAKTYFYNERRATADGEEYYDPRFGQTVKGKGGGSDAVIEFDPWQYMYADCFRDLSPLVLDPLHQFQADDVLFHEMVHALRIMSGLLLHRKLQTQVKVTFATVEEFYAVMLTDIYVSECGGTLAGVRIDHAAAFHSIQDSDDYPQKDPESYKRVFEEPIKKLCEQMGDFTRAIADLVSIKWNPLHYYYHPTKVDFNPPIFSPGGLNLSGNGSAGGKGAGIPVDSPFFPKGWTPKP
jgi:hypothetical protein